jgi:hypothetical protein
MVRIRRFGVVKTATIVAVMYVLIVAIFVVPFAILAAAAGRGDGSGTASFVLIGVFVALFYGLIGWVFTAIACAIYNIAAGWVGGIEVELENVVPPPPPPAWGPSAPPPAPPAAG